MFCSNCGNQIPEGTAFCSNCGNRVGGSAPANNSGYRAAYSNGPSPLAKSLVTKLAGFFTTTRQEAVVADAAKDTTWSGAIVAAIGVVIFALTQLLNVGAAARGYFQLDPFGVSLGDSWDAMEGIEIAIPFLISLLFAVIYAGALVGMTFVVAKLCKINLPFVCAVNVAAYASLSVVAANIVGTLLGLIWGPLAIACFLIGMVMSFVLIYQALVKAYDMKNAFVPFTALLFVMVLVVVVGAVCIFNASMPSMFGY